MAAGQRSGRKNEVRVVVAGDRGTGKSSLIFAAVSNDFPTNVPPVLPPSLLPDDLYPDHVPVTIVDTSSRVEHRNRLAEELKRADAIVLTYACDHPATLDSLRTFWLPELRRLEVKVPVIVVGCKLDLRDERDPFSLEHVMSPIMQEYREIDTCIECSASNHIQNPEVFYYAQRAVLHPTTPLFDQETQTLRPRCRRALKRIFILCDHDHDGALNDSELNGFQVKCFSAPLQPAEIVGVQRVVQEQLPGGVNENGLTLAGFILLHTIFIERSRPETTWTVLRSFGYNNEIRLTDDNLPPTFRRAPDQSVELTKSAIDFLKGEFFRYDTNNDGSLRLADLDELFSTAPESPWSEAPYRDAAPTMLQGGMSIDGFLSMWALMTRLEPAKSVEYLKYVMYDGDAASAIRVTRKRCMDRKRKQSDREVFRCFIFGPEKAGKSALLNSFLGRPFSENSSSNSEGQYAVGVVNDPTGTKKTLLLREIAEDEVKMLLSIKECLADCDIAVFVYDSSNEKSWERTAKLLVEVASHGENTGYEVPCLIVASKDDLDPHPMSVIDSTRVSQQMGIDTPILVSAKLRDVSNVFQRIIVAAQRPHMSIPETEAGRKRKQYQRLVNHSLMFVSAGAAVAFVGMAAYRVYAAKRNASS